MKCSICSKKLSQNQTVIPVFTVVENASRGDFVSSVPKGYVHLSCVSASR